LGRNTNMTDPDSHDDWSELTRELGIENASASSTADEPAPSTDAAVPYPDHGVPSDEDAGTPDEVGEAENEGDEVQGGEGQPGMGRKRRRRRRRRKKGGTSSPDAGASQSAQAEEAGEDEEDAESYPSRATGEYHEADDEGAMEIKPEAAPLAAEEDTGGDLLRDLIATWNVPSWDDIVGGLYRPER
jgi:ribonuclease E